jgi:hypothetical protein
MEGSSFVVEISVDVHRLNTKKVYDISETDCVSDFKQMKCLLFCRARCMKLFLHQVTCLPVRILHLPKNVFGLGFQVFTLVWLWSCGFLLCFIPFLYTDASEEHITSIFSIAGNARLLPALDVVAVSHPPPPVRNRTVICFKFRTVMYTKYYRKHFILARIGQSRSPLYVELISNIFRFLKPDVSSSKNVCHKKNTSWRYTVLTWKLFQCYVHLTQCMVEIFMPIWIAISQVISFVNIRLCTMVTVLLIRGANFQTECVPFKKQPNNSHTQKHKN